MVSVSHVLCPRVAGPVDVCPLFPCLLGVAAVSSPCLSALVPVCLSLPLSPGPVFIFACTMGGPCLSAHNAPVFLLLLLARFGHRLSVRHRLPAPRFCCPPSLTGASVPACLSGLCVALAFLLVLPRTSSPCPCQWSVFPWCCVCRLACKLCHSIPSGSPLRPPCPFPASPPSLASAACSRSSSYRVCLSFHHCLRAALAVELRSTGTCPSCLLLPAPWCGWCLCLGRVPLFAMESLEHVP